MTITDLPLSRQEPVSVTDSALRHIRDVEALVTLDEDLVVVTAMTEPRTSDLVSHLVAHLRTDPSARPGTPVLRDRDGDFDCGAARRWLGSLPLERLVEMHTALHADVCAFCSETVLAAHLSLGQATYWVHADGSRRCGPERVANPSRSPQRFATVSVTMRVRLPAALGAEVSDAAVAAYVDRRYVGYFTDTYDPDIAARPSEVLSTDVEITDVSPTP